MFTNIAVLCEMLALPMEAAEAWLTLAKLPGISADEAVEATGRAIALESVAHPERSPLIRFRSRIAPLSLPLGEDGSAALELLEDKLRHDPRCEVASFDRSAWVSRNAAPPRSAWRIYEVPISYYGRTYQEGKKIGWRDGVRALYCILKYNLFRRG